MENHQAQHPERLTDPILGPVWCRVGCDFCGAVGRYDSRAIAQAHADKHNRKHGLMSGWSEAERLRGQLEAEGRLT